MMMRAGVSRVSWALLGKGIVVTALAWLWPLDRCQADLITVANHSFEDISQGIIFNEFSFGPPAGWILYDPNNVTSGGDGPTFYVGTLTPNPPTNFLLGAPDGQRVGIAFNFFGSGGLGEYGLQQSLTAVLEANSQYTLQVDIGNIASGTAVSGDFFDLDGFPGYRVDLMAGGTVIASDLNSLANSIPEGEFRTTTLQFFADASNPFLGQSLSIRLVNLNQVDALFPTSDLEVDFDNVRLSVTAIPEPSAAVLVIAAAGIGLVARRRGRTG